MMSVARRDVAPDSKAGVLSPQKPGAWPSLRREYLLGLSRRDYESIQLEALRGRLNALKDGVAALHRRLDRQGTRQIESFGDALPLFFDHRVYKVSRVSDRVDFHDRLGNRIVNLVPMPAITKVARWCDDWTQTVGIYPGSLRENMCDTLSLAGVQRILPLRAHASKQHEGAELPGMPHDGIEPMRRMVRWVIDELPAAELQEMAC